ncbi:MAG: hypothetical protein EBU33_07395 [Sphingobacteriia bacterium]|nr:hypothetical protein [Sphingobacteriia bacterium]
MIFSCNTINLFSFLTSSVIGKLIDELPIGKFMRALKCSHSLSFLGFLFFLVFLDAVLLSDSDICVDGFIVL